MLPVELFEACPLQTVRAGAFELTLAAVTDIDPLLDFYARTQPSDDHAIPYFAVLWDSAQALAGHLAVRFPDLSGRRVVELGCGLGLPSLVAARCGAQVLATDFHPDCEAFLRRNAAQNGVTLGFRRLDWAALPDDLPAYDLVLASDVIYHVASLPHLVAAAARLCAPAGTILFADPGRDRLQQAVHAFADAGFAGELFPVGEIFVFELRCGGAVRPAP